MSVACSGAVRWLLLAFTVLRLTTSKDLPAAPLLKVPPKQPVYEFNLYVHTRVTMTTYDDYAQGYLVDYDPDVQQWSQRNSDAVDGASLERFIQGDGLHRRIITINGKSPGDVIIVPYGAEVVLRVYNALMSEGISVHIHGLDQTNRWYMDGVVPVQQCPIGAGSTFTYRFIADFAGTLWYHGHHAADRGNGLLGGFIVMEKDQTVMLSSKQKVVPDKQYSVILQDVHRLSQSEVHANLEERLMKFGYGLENTKQCYRWSKTYDCTNIGGSTPLQSIWFNQRGWHNQKDVVSRPWALPLERFMVDGGGDETVLFRVVHGGFAFELMISVEQHQFTIVAADGVKIMPVTTDYLIIFPGERYDILIKTKAKPEHKKYYIVAETTEAWDEGFAPISQRFGLAVLEYNTFLEDTQRVPDLNKTHCTTDKKCLVVNCPFETFPPGHNLTCKNVGELKSIQQPTDKGVMGTEFPPNGFQEFFINMHYDTYMNGFKYTNPQAPPYFYGSDTSATPGALKCDPVKCHPLSFYGDPECNCFFHLKLRQDAVIQLNLYNMGDGADVNHGYAHPFHLHGQHFYLMKSGTGKQNPLNGWLVESNNDIDCSNPANPGCANSTWTDRSWIGGNVTIYFSFSTSVFATSVINHLVIKSGAENGYTQVIDHAELNGWFFAHCHLVLHSWGGMAMALQVGEHSQMPKPPAGFPAGCGHFEPPPLNA